MTLKLLFRFLLLVVMDVVLPVLAAIAGYYATGIFFREEKIPYPFEWFGVVVAAGVFFWTLGIVSLVVGLIKRKAVLPSREFIGRESKKQI